MRKLLLLFFMLFAVTCWADLAREIHLPKPVYGAADKKLPMTVMKNYLGNSAVLKYDATEMNSQVFFIHAGLSTEMNMPTMYGAGFLLFL